MDFVGETLTSLFSTIISLYTLLLLYFPSFFLQFIFSPVVISTLLLLLYLLRLGAAQKSTVKKNESDPSDFNSMQPLPKETEDSIDRDQKWAVLPVSGSGSELGLCSGYEIDDPNRFSHPFYADSFVEWDVRAPLEVIYEEYEGEEAEINDAVSEAMRESKINIIQRYASLSLYYPESDTDASSDGEWDSTDNMCFRWEEEDDRDGLIEIALVDEKRNSDVDEENLIEIDLSPAR